MSNDTVVPAPVRELIPEEPLAMGGVTYSVRRTPGTLRYAVFADPGPFGPLGYLVPVQGPGAWRIEVRNAANRERGKPAAGLRAALARLGECRD
jgi:hypothetical protein